jgi:ATP-binding cassette subfamily F protein 3
MLSISNLSYSIGDRFLYQDLSLFVKDGEKLALAGKNGSGKTTLLNMIADGSQREITLPNSITIGYLPQHLKVNSTKAIIEEVKEGLSEFLREEKRMKDILHELETRTDYESDSYMKLSEDLADCTDKLGVLELDKLDANAAKLLRGLGFEEEDLQRPYDSFSGGWKMRVELGKILLKEPDLFLLDEPTNHLDINSILWLEDYLKEVNAAVIVISHDRRFLDNLTTRTIEVVNGKIFDFPFSYTKYQAERAFRFEQMSREAKNQQKEIKRNQDLINKFKAKASKASMAKSLEKKLNRMELVDVDIEDTSKPNIKFLFSENSGREVVKVKNLSKSFGEKEVLNNVNFTISRGTKVALLGKNGIGKSTLIKILRGDHKATTGSFEFGHNVQPSIFMQDASETLEGNKTVLKSIEDVASHDTFTNCRKILGSFLFSGADVDKKVKVLSGGEKNRVVLASMAINPYNTLILDEPTNHLDIKSKEELKKAIKDFPGTVLLVSHDREFLTGLCSHILEVKHGEVKEFIGDIDEYLEKERKTFFEFNASSNKKESAVPAPEISKQVKKEKPKASSNKLGYIEKKIEEKEKEQVVLEGLIAKPTDKLEKQLELYEKVKQELEELMLEWEECAK